jgi:hypothetical protein
MDREHHYRKRRVAQHYDRNCAQDNSEIDIAQSSLWSRDKEVLMILLAG